MIKKSELKNGMMITLVNDMTAMVCASRGILILVDTELVSIPGIIDNTIELSKYDNNLNHCDFTKLCIKEVIGMHKAESSIVLLSDEHRELIKKLNILIKTDDINGLDKFVNTLDNVSIFRCIESIDSVIIKAFFISRYNPKLTIVG